MLTKEQFAKMQDHSILGAGFTQSDVKKFCNDVLKYGFAAVYVNPCWVSYARELIGDKASVGTVISFPQGNGTTKTKIAEGLDAIDNGANELDVVMNISKFKSGDYDYVQKDLNRFVEAMKAKEDSVLVKVIIETFYLNHDDKVRACEIVADSGADYIKQSTGTTYPQNFWLGDIRLMRKLVGDRIKIKSAGWIINIEDALATIDEGASRIGAGSAHEWMEEFDKQLWFDK